MDKVELEKQRKEAIRFLRQYGHDTINFNGRVVLAAPAHSAKNLMRVYMNGGNIGKIALNDNVVTTGINAKKYSNKYSGEKPAVVDVLQQRHAEIGEIAPEAGVGKGALLALVPAEDVAEHPGQNELDHHAHSGDGHIPALKGHTQVHGADVQKQLGGQHDVVHQVGGAGNVVLRKHPLVGQKTPQTQQHKQRQAHIEAEQQILQQINPLPFPLHSLNF